MEADDQRTNKIGVLDPCCRRDPLDIIILIDVPTFAGCLMTARPVGVIESNQTQDGKTFRNDRLIAVADAAHEYGKQNPSRSLIRSSSTKSSTSLFLTTRCGIESSGRFVAPASLPR